MFSLTGQTEHPAWMGVSEIASRNYEMQRNAIRKAFDMSEYLFPMPDFTPRPVTLSFWSEWSRLMSSTPVCNP